MESSIGVGWEMVFPLGIPQLEIVILKVSGGVGKGLVYTGRDRKLNIWVFNLMEPSFPLKIPI